MTDQTHSRRAFLGQSGVLLGTAWAGLNLPAVLAAAEQARAQQDAGVQWTTLDAGEAVTLSALADQIIPPDDTPGAAAMGAVHFMDAALVGFMAGMRGAVRTGAEDLDALAQAEAGAEFHALPFDAQKRLVRTIESSPFFAAVHMLTLMGVFAMPRHGGNIEQAGWKLLGFEPRHAWQPPFGAYDAEYPGEPDDAGA